MKENRNSHAYITSAYDQPNSKVKTKLSNNNKKRASTTQRPTMGGKTISAINKTQSKAKMSPQELKSLSRRINPSEPLATPHSSPSKPPLPSSSSISSSKKRRNSRQAQTQPTKIIKIDDDEAQLICEPCNKKYKTRNGLVYHSERCKYKSIESNVIIKCICQDDTTTSDSSTMIECVACNTWLHIKCVGSVTDEANYRCIRCTKEEDVSSKIIKLSELYPKIKEESTDYPYISLFSDDEPLNTLWEDGLTPSTVDFTDWQTETPCLLLSDDSSSHLNDFSSSELLSPALLPQSDWFHFANFELDFQAQQEHNN
ncbi:hypothetical protein INT48_009184 [Thamnidium elegans]|uniref:Zinc finger PHD-type domain-containing protein n=1 Tax=Thamnidium elegans TaxID=101142 RepID=A0A8H7VVQ6_9FUNG|nr:hypothetical protein INT48_009184 [Thamnidium elegans]